MKILEQIRKGSFWFLDAIQGKKVSTHLHEIKQINSHPSDSEHVVIYQNNKLYDLLRHATKTTVFYGNLIKHNDSDVNLSNFPVIDKQVIKANQEDFFSIIYKSKRLFGMSTSGSTGSPFTCYQDKNKKRRVNAEIIHYSQKAGYDVGKNLIYLRALTSKSRKSIIKLFAQNETLIDVSDLSSNKFKEMISIATNASRNGSMLLSYGSTLDSIKNHIVSGKIEGELKLNITGVVSSSDMLYDETREIISKTFGCPVYSRYSNQENGVIGQDDTINNCFLLNEANYIVEIFDENLTNLMPVGEVGNIVVTDLFNYASPMIRYNTGDIGAIEYLEIDGILRKSITNFGGRSIDSIFDTKGTCLSPHSISNNMCLFPEVLEYQFIQETRTSYVIKLVVNDFFKSTDSINKYLKQALGEDAEIELKIVDKIEPLSSGKRRYILNNYKPRRDSE